MKTRTIILVRFVNDVNDVTSKEYAYFTNDETIKKDDWVVVNTNGIFKCVKVSQVKGLTARQASYCTKWIVHKVEIEEYEKKMVQLAIEQEIRNKLRQRKQEMEEWVIYRQLAQSDPEIKTLLVELQGLTGETFLLPNGEKLVNEPEKFPQEAVLKDCSTCRVKRIVGGAICSTCFDTDSGVYTKWTPKNS